MVELVRGKRCDGAGGGGADSRGGSLTRRAFVGAVAGVGLAGAGALLSACGGGAASGAGASASASASGQAASSSAAAASGAASSAASPEASGAIPTSARQFEQISRTLFAFDTVVTLKASCSESALDEAANLCARFESLFSRTVATSDIGRINAAGGAPVQVAPETADIIQKALAYCAQSEGRFDITIGAASTLWDFKEGVVPEPAALEEAVKHIDYSKVQVEGQTVTLLDPQAKLDLGGIAKGYIADALCRQLADAGCDSGFVNLGGNVKTIGVKPDGKPWHVGIQDPNDVEGAVVAAVYSQGQSCVTSGLYERRFSKGGRDYWHILDPKTGYPVETDLVSATIISDASIDGDGFTKPLFMMGHDAALAWINAQEGLEGLVVSRDGAITQSDGCHAELR